MIDMNDSSAQEILSQDFEYCLKAFENDNFNLMNIAANRLMENSIFLENKEIFLIAAIFKDIANDYMGIVQKKRNTLNSAKVLGKNTIDSIKLNLNKSISIEKLLRDFFEFTVNINDFHKDELESQVYLKNTKFTSLVFEKILKFLEENKSSLKKINSTLLTGILNVMIRIFKNHSCTLKENMVYLYFKLLTLLHLYVIEKTFPEEQIIEEDFKKYLEIHIDYIVKSYLNNDLDFEKYCSKLWEIGKQYRELYLIFNPPRLVVRPVPEQVPALVRVPMVSSKINEIEEKEGEEN